MGEPAARRYRPRPLLKDEAFFWHHKGQAFRALWGRRLAAGLTFEQEEAWVKLVDAFYASDPYKEAQAIMKGRRMGK